MNNKLKGCIAAAIGAATYGLNPLFSLPLYSGAGFSPVVTLFYRYFLATAMVGILFKFRGGRLLPAKGESGALVFGAILMIVSSWSLFQAYLYMDSGIVSTLLFIYPVAVAAIMSLFFKEKLTCRTAISIALAITGVVILAKSETSRPFDWRGLVLSLISAFFYSFYIVAIKVTPLKNIEPEKISFYTMIIGAAVYLAMFDFTAGFPLPPNAKLWACVLLLAFFPTVTALVMTAKAIHLVGATPTAIFGGLEPAVAVLCGVVVFGEKFTVSIAAGVVLVIISVIMVITGKNSTVKADN